MRTKVKTTLTKDHFQKTCEHKYECVYEGWEGESYECKKCRHRYKLYYEDMA